MTRSTSRSDAPMASPTGSAPYLDPETARRAALPEILLIADLALAFRMTPSGTARAVHRGLFGPWGRVGRKIVLRRESVLATLRSREVAPPLISPAPIPVAPQWAKDLLARGRRSRR